MQIQSTKQSSGSASSAILAQFFPNGIANPKCKKSQMLVEFSHTRTSQLCKSVGRKKWCGSAISALLAQFSLLIANPEYEKVVWLAQFSLQVFALMVGASMEWLGEHTTTREELNEPHYL